MDTALPQKILFILDRNLAKANCTEDRVWTSCDTVVLASRLFPLVVPKVIPVQLSSFIMILTVLSNY